MYAAKTRDMRMMNALDMEPLLVRRREAVEVSRDGHWVSRARLYERHCTADHDVGTFEHRDGLYEYTVPN